MLGVNSWSKCFEEAVNEELLAKLKAFNLGI